MIKVIIYTTTTCPFCKMEKDYLNSKSIQYDEILVDNDPERAKIMIERSGQMGVPFTIIQKENGNEINILGFDKSKIDEALKLESGT